VRPPVAIAGLTVIVPSSDQRVVSGGVRLIAEQSSDELSTKEKVLGPIQHVRFEVRPFGPIVPGLEDGALDLLLGEVSELSLEELGRSRDLTTLTSSPILGVVVETRSDSTEDHSLCVVSHSIEQSLVLELSPIESSVEKR